MKIKIETNLSITWDKNDKIIAFNPMIALVHENNEITIGIIFLIFNATITFKIKKNE